MGRVVVGRYLLLRPLGDGGRGRVWLAHDQLLSREVALEAARTGTRNLPRPPGHPHVVTVHEVVEHEGVPWVVMEYVAGAVGLGELVARRGPLAPADCARIGLAVLTVLGAPDAGRERNGPHREVEPADILLAPDRGGAPYGRILLLDHVVARPVDGDGLLALGRTLHYAVEGHEPSEREVPGPPVRAGALGPLLERLLAGDRARRVTVAEAEAELAWIVTPQTETYARPRTDPGSQPPWSAAHPAVPGPAASAGRGARPRAGRPRPGVGGGGGVGPGGGTGRGGQVGRTDRAGRPGR
ncbi:serine/threonine protein phosphatase, partial [Streptomyces sp. WG7]